MPKSGINLIPGEEKASFEVIILAKKFKTYALFSLIVFLIVILGYFIAFFRMNSHLKSLSQKISQAEAKINSYKSLESDLVLVKDRLVKIKKIFSTQKRKIEALKKIKEVSPPEIVFRSIESSSKELKISVTSSDLGAIKRFTERISNPEFEKIFKKIEISAVSRVEEGNYGFNLGCFF